jgi:hypothetical protein
MKMDFVFFPLNNFIKSYKLEDIKDDYSYREIFYLLWINIGLGKLHNEISKMINIYRYHVSQSDGWRFNFSTNPILGEGW